MCNILSNSKKVIIIQKDKMVKVCNHPSSNEKIGKIFKKHKNKFLIIDNKGDLIQVNKEQIKMLGE